MPEHTLNFTRGINKKPVATEILQQALQSIDDIHGECFFGYPLIATPDGKYSIDSTLVSPEKGIVLFDLVEGTDVGDIATRQDDLVNKVEARLKLHRDLVKGRNLRVPLSIVTFAPAVASSKLTTSETYPLANDTTLPNILSEITWEDGNEQLYRLTLSAIESLSSIRKSRTKREITRPDSRGAKLKKLEDSIATLDHRQNRAVIETVEGVQRMSSR
jgi:superfamily I DNA and RNA helicase